MTLCENCHGDISEMAAQKEAYSLNGHLFCSSSCLERACRTQASHPLAYPIRKCIESPKIQGVLDLEPLFYLHS
jgi:hypothetical protein